MHFRITSIIVALLSSVVAESNPSMSHEESSKKRIYGYLHTRSQDGTKKRTHVYALTTAGTLAQRITSKIDEWREPTGEQQEPNRYTCELEFASPEIRNVRVMRLYASITDYNKLATQYFEREGKTVLPSHLFEMREKFGPDYKENNQYLPSQSELNRLHVQFATFSGTGDEDKYSKVWGQWENLFQDDLIRHMGYSEEEARAIDLWRHPEKVPQDALTVRMSNSLEKVNKRIHATEAVKPFAVHSRFSFNTLRLSGGFRSEPLADEDFEPDRWRLSLEIGGLYVQYAQTGKNLLNIMHDNDFESLQNNDEQLDKIQFQRIFANSLYAVWAPIHPTEEEKKRMFKSWWDKHDITGKYGYEWGKREEPNGFIKLGSQICDPPSDCDRSWMELMDKFAETPIVEDLIFSTEQPYGNTENDLRFLYSGDEASLQERKKAWWFISWLYTPLGYPGLNFPVIKSEIMTWWLSSWFYNSLFSIDSWSLKSIGSQLGVSNAEL